MSGRLTGAVLGAAFAWLWPYGWLAGVSAGVLGVSACSFLGLLFTGCTPYTSDSGVCSEMSWALPVQGSLALVRLTERIVARFV